MEPKLDTLLSLHIKLTLYLYPCAYNVAWRAIYILTRPYSHLLLYCYICALCCCLAHVVFLITIYVHVVTLRSFVVVKGCRVSVGSTGVGRGMVSI